MLRKLDHFLFVGVHVAFYLFFLYGLTVYAPNHFLTPIFWIFGIVVTLMEVTFRICNYRTNKRIERYITNGFREY